MGAARGAVDLVPLRPPKQFRQPCDVERDAARLVGSQHLGLPCLVRVLTRVELGERLTAGVADDVAARYRVGAPGRREGEGRERGLLDHLVGGGQQRFRDGKAERLGGLLIDGELKLGRLHDR
jgi:hypothetical protein